MAGLGDKRGMSDEELLYKLRNGDEQAFNVLVERYYGPLSRVAYRMTKDIEETKDACQHAFCVLFESIITDKFDIKKPYLMAFLCKVARNMIITEIRQKEKLKETIKEGKIKTGIGGNDPGNNIIATELQQIIKSVLLKFPEQEREAFVLYYGTPDMSFEKIGSKLGISLNTARNYVYRAKNKLCHKLRQILGEGEIDYV